MSAESDRRRRRLRGQEVFDVVAKELTELPDVDRSMMFGSNGIRVRGKFLAFVGAEGELVVKVPAARAAELVAAGTGSRVRIGRNLAKEWLAIPLRGRAGAAGRRVAVPPAPDADHGDLWQSLLLEAYRHVAA